MQGFLRIGFYKIPFYLYFFSYFFPQINFFAAKYERVFFYTFFLVNKMLSVTHFNNIKFYNIICFVRTWKKNDEENRTNVRARNKMRHVTVQTKKHQKFYRAENYKKIIIFSSFQ